MAVFFIGRFQDGYDQVTIYGDSITGEVSYETLTVDFTEYNKPLPGVFYRYFCIGYNEYSYVSQDAAPYANSTINVDSPSCGYNPGGDPLQINNVVTTNETSYGANDGTFNMDVTGGTGPYLITFDNSNFNPLQLPYTGIAPGFYTFIVQDQNGLQTFGGFNIVPAAAILGCTDVNALNYDPNAQVDNGTCIYPNPDVIDSRNNIYETEDQFRLIDSNNTIYLIEMPRGWESIVFKLQRDPQYHGVNNEFTDGEIQLDFDEAAGKLLLDAEYSNNGNDGYMRFQFGVVYPDGTFIPDVDGFIDFNDRIIDRDFFSTSVKSKRFNDAIETKNDIDVTIVDGYTPLNLHSKTIRRQAIINKLNVSSSDNLYKNEIEGDNPNAPAPGDDPFLIYWTFMDFSPADPANNKTTFFLNDLTPQAPTMGTTQSNPVATFQYLFKTDGAAQFSFHIDAKGTYTIGAIHINGANPRIGYWSYKWYVCINDFSNRYEIPGGVSGFYGEDDGIRLVIPFTMSFNQNINIAQGDRVYLFGQFVCESRGYQQQQMSLNFEYSNVDISGNTIAAPSIAQGKLIFELFQDVLNNISGGTAKLVSNLLGRTDLGYQENGCAALIAYTCGYLIRQFSLDDRKMIVKLKDLIEGLDANYCIGMAYELNDENEWVYRIEQFEYFYQDVLIRTFDNVSDYKEETNPKYIYNELKFGFEKYTQELESVTTIDEFLTQHNYLMPIESAKATLQRLCKQIGGGYPIELTRRKPYSQTSNDSWTYDESNFIIAVVNSQQFGYIPEKLESFTASGIIGPDTVYNLRLTITRALSRWGKFINSGIAYKKPSAVLKNTYTSKNGDLKSQYTGNQQCETKKEFIESESLLKGDLQSAQQKFFPEDISFKTKVSWTVIQEIRRCFTNKDTLGRNNGYFGVVDGNGVTQYGYLLSLEYNPLDESALFVLRKKYVDLNEPFDCSDYSLYTFEDFEEATGLPGEIEQCLFENFA